MSKVARPLHSLHEKEHIRFWSKVAMKSDTDCWLWQIGKRGGGYGAFKVKMHGKKRTIPANRIAYFFWYGVDPAEKYVLHVCDNPPCCNPHHLFLGTPLDNTLDMIAKGRKAVGQRAAPKNPATGRRSGAYTHPEKRHAGSSNGRAKLNDDDIREIRHKISSLLISKQEIANLKGVSKQTIDLIMRGKRYANVE